MDKSLEMRKQLRTWFQSDLGQDLLSHEKQVIDRILPGLFGYHLLQIGSVGQEDFVAESRIGNKLLIDLELTEVPSHLSGLISTSHSLPIAANSMDVVVLPHILEFAPRPHQILREVNRVLIGEGHVIITGFNPLSWWGLWRVLLAWSEKPPFTGHYLSLNRLKDWLTLLDFEIVNTDKFFFRPPIMNKKVMQRLLAMEKLGRYLWPFCGGVYLLVAKKRVIPLTPVKMQWRSRRHMIASGFAEPSTRQ